jgi:hypothetical protein
MGVFTREIRGRHVTSVPRDYHAEYLRRRGTGHEKNRIKYLKYQKDYGRMMREVLKKARDRAEYRRQWRARKARQVMSVGEFLEAFDHFEYVKRCVEVSNETRSRK